MPQPIPFVAPGDSIARTFTAEYLNSIVERVNGSQARRPRTIVPDSRNGSTVECYAINNTSQLFDVHSCLTPNTVGLTVSTAQEKITFQQSPLLDVIVPTASDEFPVIALEPIKPNGGIGRVAIGGLAVCTVNVTDAGHEFANLTNGDESKMTSGATGRAEILYKASGTGDKTAVVYLPGGRSSAGGETWHVANIQPPYDGSSVVVDTGSSVVAMSSSLIYDHGYITVPAGSSVKGIAHCSVRMVKDGANFYPDQTRFFTTWTTGTNANVVVGFPSTPPYFAPFSEFNNFTWVIYPGMFGINPATNPIPVDGFPMTVAVMIYGTNSDGADRQLAIRRTDNNCHNQMQRGTTNLHYCIY
jgi:hypothetical protein